jgi:hypothetical protein
MVSIGASVMDSGDAVFRNDFWESRFTMEGAKAI